jgi:hypothetical protein
MAKRSVSGFRPTGLRIDEPFYSDADIDHIVEVSGGLPEGNFAHRRATPDGMDFETVVVSRREALSDSLESAARDWDIRSQFQTKPTSKQVAQSHERIARCAARLCEALELPKGGSLDDVPEAIRYGPMLAAAEAEGENLDEAVLAVQGILRWSLPAAEQGGETDRLARHEGDPALDGLFRRLIRIWVEIFERKITKRETTPKEGPPRAAPTIRFIQAALRPLLNDAMPSTESVRKRVLRIV